MTIRSIGDISSVFEELKEGQSWNVKRKREFCIKVGFKEYSLFFLIMKVIHVHWNISFLPFLFLYISIYIHVFSFA